MTKDIRIAITFPNHPKTIKLRRKIGHKGIDCLLKLWCFCGEYRTKGDLSNMTDEDIAIAAGWDEEPKVFITALLEVGYLQARHATADNNARYHIHGWKDHNPWAYYADERSEMAQVAAEARWGKQRKGGRKQSEKGQEKMPDGCDMHARRMRDACATHAEGNAPSPSPFPPPSPSPRHGGAGAPSSSSDEAKDALQKGIAMLLGQFNAEEREFVDKFLAQAASERKSGKMSDRTRHALLNELFQVRADFPDRFLAGMEETTDREAPNVNYLRKVITGLGQQKQRSLRFRDARRRREEYEATRKARDKADREHERNLEERKRRERARQDQEAERRKGAPDGSHGAGEAGGGMPGAGRGHGPTGDRRPPQNDKEQGAPAAAQGRGAVGDRGGGAAYAEVSLSDHLGPASPGASHADGEQPGNGDDGCGALVPA